MTPTATLLEALRRFLQEQVQPELSGFNAYQNRIASNLLRILQRDVRLGPVLQELDSRFAETAGLASKDFLGTLARGIRDGQVEDSAALRQYLQRRALLALAIDNPRYSGYLQAREAWPAIAQWLDQWLDSHEEADHDASV